jgi:DNA-binding CsgD family transcriptional regulator
MSPAVRLIPDEATRRPAAATFHKSGIRRPGRRAYNERVSDSVQRGIDKIAELARQPVDLVTLWQRCTEVIASRVAFYQAPCWYTFDPASLLITSHFHQGLPEFPAEWLADEYYQDGVMKLVDVARSQSGIETLHEAVAGDVAETARCRRNMTMGGDQELMLQLRSKTGQVWGVLALYREPERPLFDAADKRFLSAIAPHLADGARRALLFGEANDPDGLDAPGLLILNERWEVESATPGTGQWLDELRDGDPRSQQLPASVLALAGRTLRGAEQPGDPCEVTAARVLARNGTWVMLHGASLIAGASRRVAIIVEPAHPARIHPLLMTAYGLTGREQEITRLILQGNSTTEIATELHLSPHTVQQHLKNIFDKTGVRSRRDLVGKVFFAHYEPRLRDNEKRALEYKSARGGPIGDGKIDHLRSEIAPVHRRAPGMAVAPDKVSIGRHLQ